MNNLKTTGNRPHPPSGPLRFFRWYCHPDYQEDIEGDLRERFERNAIEKGIKAKTFKVIINEPEKEKHRHLKHIFEIIENSELHPDVKANSIGIFDLLAEAEGKVHGVSKESVHFHEVGAIDSIIDIVSICLLMKHFSPQRILCTPIAIGTGFIRTAHGQYPAPAPATLELLTDLPIRQLDMNTEITTPTGAAAIKYFTHAYQLTHNLKVKKIGYGSGTRDLSIPNVLRTILLEQEPSDQTIMQIETNLDDISAESVAHCLELLMQQGALDVFITPVTMKKSRSGVLLTVLTNHEKVQEMEEIIFRNTTTFGLRKSIKTRTILPRKIEKVNIGGIDIDIKLGFLNGQCISKTPEFESVKKASQKLGKPFISIYRKTLSACQTLN